MKQASMTALLVAAAAGPMSQPVPAAAQDRFLARLKLPTGQTVVVAEGDDAARSISSFSVRLHRAAPAQDQTAFFPAG